MKKPKTAREALTLVRKTMRAIENSDVAFVYVHMEHLGLALEYLLKRLARKEAERKIARALDEEIDTPRHAAMKLQWSKPHHGVQHLSGIPALDGNTNGRRTHQITCEDRDAFVRVYVLYLTGGCAFSPTHEKICATLAEAHRWGEERAKELAK